MTSLPNRKTNSDKINKQTSKQTNKRTNKQTSRQTRLNKQTKDKCVSIYNELRAEMYVLGSRKNRHRT